MTLTKSQKARRAVKMGKEGMEVTCETPGVRKVEENKGGVKGARNIKVLFVEELRSDKKKLEEKLKAAYGSFEKEREEMRQKLMAHESKCEETARQWREWAEHQVKQQTVQLLARINRRDETIEMLKGERDWRRRKEQGRSHHRPVLKSVQDDLERARSRRAAEKVAVEKARKRVASVEKLAPEVASVEKLAPEVVAVEKLAPEVVAVEKLGGDAGGKVASRAESSQRAAERKLLVAERVKVREEQRARRTVVMERARKEPKSKALISSSSEEETEREVVLEEKGSTEGAGDDKVVEFGEDDGFLDFISLPEIL